MKYMIMLWALAVLIHPVKAFAGENTPNAPSICQAIAGLGPEHFQNRFAVSPLPVTRASGKLGFISDRSPSEVSITYVGHSTFRIETSQEITIATDFAGFAGAGVIPDVVTMNHAHGTHFTISPDSRIDHVLRGWGTDGKPANHYKQIGNVLIRNVTTDINNQWAGYEPDGNSIFIFEVAGLCIGHLGHLHHLPNDHHYSRIGRLDVLMVPVDGGYTMNVEDMALVVRRVNASVILPMHWFGPWSLGNFLAEIETAFPVETLPGSELKLSLKDLPARPTIMVLTPEASIGNNGSGGD